MLQHPVYEIPCSDVDPDLLRLEPDAFERWLPDVLPRLVSQHDFEGFHEDTGPGAPPCNPFVLTGMLLLQFRYGLSDRELVRRCHRDLGFKYAVGLARNQGSPSTSSVKRHRYKIRKKLGDDVLHRRMLELAVADGLMPDKDLQAIDSTNTDCRGAVIDTFNLIAVGIMQVIRAVAVCLNVRAEDLARRWEMSDYLARSIKSKVNIDWSDPEARNKLLTAEIRDADRISNRITELEKTLTLPDAVYKASELLQKVARQDVEQLPDGSYRIAKGTAPGRVISITDSEARHGRKSSSKVINGFKTNVTGTIVTQFVTGIKNTNASVPDANPTGELIRQTEENGVKPRELIGDCAYGTGANIREGIKLGVEIRTKMPAPSRRSSIPKRDFDIDLREMRVICPEGVVSEKFTFVKDPGGSEEDVQKFHFDKNICNQCPRRRECSSTTIKGLGRKITLSCYEEELQKTKAFNNTERAVAVLRSRSAIERLISHLVHMGMRHARFFGMYNVQFQSFMTAAAYNLQRYITLSLRRRFADVT
jgi:hypothetical protein